MTIDYILKFDSEDAAHEATSVLDPVNEWDSSRTIPGLTVTDQSGDIVPGWFIRVGNDLPNNLNQYLYTLPEGYTAQPVFEGT